MGWIQAEEWMDQIKAKTGQNEKSQERKKKEKKITKRNSCQNQTSNGIHVAPDELYSYKVPWVMRLIFLLKCSMGLSMQ